jgi:nitrous oxide reductase accessory protein NosL
MKKTSFVVAILASALLAGACSKKKDAAAPTPPAGDMGSAAGSGSDMGSGSAGSGSSAGGW